MNNTKTIYETINCLCNFCVYHFILSSFNVIVKTEKYVNPTWVHVPTEVGIEYLTIDKSVAIQLFNPVSICHVAKI